LETLVFTGIQGETGIIGNTGIQGETGIIGNTGIQGDTGVIGETGIQGIQGDTGVTGETGIQGIQGDTGVIGETGIEGIQGATGTLGIDGETGIQGIQGETGIIGSTGAGIQGDTGVGTQGVTGLVGDDGTDGVIGETGLTGETGAFGGPAGETGIQGVTGPAGTGTVSGTGGTGGVDIVQDEITGYTGLTPSFTGEYTYGADGVYFYRNGILMDKVASFTATGTDNSAEYQEVDNADTSTDLTLNSTNPAVHTEVFNLIYLKPSANISALDPKAYGFGYTDSSGTPLDIVSFTVVGGVTRVTFNFAIDALDVIFMSLNGNNIPEYVAGTTLGGYWERVSGQPTQIDLDADYSSANYALEARIFAASTTSQTINPYGFNFDVQGTGETALLTDFDTGQSTIFADSGTLGGVFEISETTTDLIRETKTYKYTNHATAGSSINDWVRRGNLLIDQGYRGHSFDIKFKYRSSYSNGNVYFVAKDMTNNAVIYNKLVSNYEDLTFYSSQSYLARFDIPLSCAQLSYGFHILTGESSKVITWDDISVAASYDEAVFEEEDSVIRLTDHIGFGSTNIAIRRFNTIVENKGSAISYQSSSTLGDSFTALEDGFYSVSFTGTYTGSIVSGISKNSTQLSTGFHVITSSDKLAADLTGGNGYEGNCSWSGPLLAGDVIRPHTQVSAVAGDAHRASFSIAKHAGLKRASTTFNSEVPLSTTYLRMEGCSTIGTGAEAATKKFNSIAIFYGDGLSVDNANGTIVTINKKGFLHITGSAATGGTLRISKNASNPASIPPIGPEALVTTSDATGAALTPFLWTGSVSIGDKIRIADNSHQGDTSATLNCVLLEETVQVNISNVQPQFEDVDSMVRVHTANGHGSTNIKIRRFSSIESNIGTAITYVDSASEGASFTVNEDGVYHASFSGSGNPTFYIGLSLNSNQLTTNISSIAVGDRLAITYESIGTGASHASWSGYLQAGDVVRPHTQGTTGTAAYVMMTMAKQGNPSVTGVDVTPFAVKDVLNTQNTSLDTGISWGSSDTSVRYFTNTASDSGSGFYVVTSNSTNGTSITVTRKSTITFTYTADFSSGRNFGLSLNASSLTADYQNLPFNEKLGHSFSTSTDPMTVTVTKEFNIGDVVRPHDQIAGATAGTQAELIISAVGTVSDMIVTTSNQTLTPWEAFTPTGQFTVFSTYSGRWRRVGDSMEIEANVAFGSAPTPSGSFYLNIPNSENIDTNKITSTTIGVSVFGVAGANDAGVDNFVGNVTYNNNTSVAIVGRGSGASPALWSNSYPIAFNNSDVIRLRFTVPIQGWDVAGGNFLLGIPRPKIAYIKDIKSGSTPGGTFTQDAWRQRILNVLSGTTDFITLINSQVTLVSGTYKITWNAPGYSVGRHVSRFYNITDSFTEILGSTSYAVYTYAVNNYSLGSGEVTITKTKTFELQHWCDSTYATHGFGLSSPGLSGVDSIFSQIIIEKLR